MRTIKQLLQNEKKVYIYLRNETVKAKFSQEADKEGITFGDDKKATERLLDEIMALLPEGNICYPGLVGRICFGSGTKNAIRIDYEKYANGEKNYIINYAETFNLTMKLYHSR